MSKIQAKVLNTIKYGVEGEEARYYYEGEQVQLNAEDVQALVTAGAVEISDNDKLEAASAAPVLPDLNATTTTIAADNQPYSTPKEEAEQPEPDGFPQFVASDVKPLQEQTESVSKPTNDLHLN